MPKCPNCGRNAVITEHWACQWCGYPLVSRPYAKARARQEAQEAKRAKEQEERAEKLVEEAEKRTRKEAEQQAKEQAKREAQEVKRTKEQEERAKKLAEEAEKIVQDIDADVYEGEFQLVFPLDTSSKQLKQFEEHLRKVEDLMILTTGWSSDEGSIISVSSQKPLNLLHLFNEMPAVEKVFNKGRKIGITLKTLLDNSGAH